MTTDLKAESYISLLQTLKQEITQARIKAHLSVNKEMIILYWNIGKKILERQTDEGWGTKVIENISKDLRQEFPEMKGLSAQNLKYMRKFAEEYTLKAISQQAVDQIPWGHIIKVIYDVKDKQACNWYIRKTIENGWSRNVLNMQIKTNLYARDGKGINNFLSTLPAAQSDLARDIIKDPYNLEFLDIQGKVLERELETKLIDHIRKFLLELGQGFAFIGNQYHLELFDVVAAQTKKDPNQLRANTAQRMENNKAMVANQAHDIKRLEIYKKDALTMGAGLKNEKTRMQQKMDRYRKKGFSEDQIRNEISKDLEKRLDKLKTDKSGVLISALRKDLELYKLYDSVSMNHEVEKLGQIIYLLEKIDTLDPKKSTEFINGGFLEINDKDKKMLKGLTSLGTNQDGQDQLIHSGDFIKQLKFSHDNGKTVIKLESHRSQDVKIANKELSENVTKSEHNFTLGLQVSKVKIVKAFEVEGNVGLQYQYNNSTSTTSKKLDYTIFESENLSRYLTGLTEGCTTTSQFGNSKYYNGLYGIGSLKLDMQDLQEKAFWSDDEN